MALTSYVEQLCRQLLVMHKITKNTSFLCTFMISCKEVCHKEFQNSSQSTILDIIVVEVLATCFHEFRIPNCEFFLFFSQLKRLSLNNLLSPTVGTYCRLWPNVGGLVLCTKQPTLACITIKELKWMPNSRAM